MSQVDHTDVEYVSICPFLGGEKGMSVLGSPISGWGNRRPEKIENVLRWLCPLSTSRVNVGAPEAEVLVGGDRARDSRRRQGTQRPGP
jgi:hypothetical protein